MTEKSPELFADGPSPEPIRMADPRLGVLPPRAPEGETLANAGPGHEALEWLHHFVTALELAPAVAVHAMDQAGIIRYWNHACEELYGITAGRAIGTPFSQLVIHLEQQDEFDARIASIWRDGVAPPPRDWLVEACTGRRHWLHSCHYPVKRDGLTQQVFCMEMDITARKEAEANLQRAAQVFQNARDAIVMMDAEYRVQTVNQAFTTITGHAPEDIIGRTLASLRWSADAGFYERIWSELDGNDHWEGELSGTRKNGETYPVRVALTTIRDPHGDISSYMAMLSDISERKRAEEHVRHLAEHDALTGLPNRVLFLDRLHQALATWRRQRCLFAVLFLDLDRFKGINDTHGHQAGDTVLREVAARLRACVRRVDTISRLGGDEFVVLLADVKGADQAAHVASTVTQAVARPISVGAHELTLSVSIGIALCPSDGDDVETLLHHADVAMYHAKQNGRNSYRFFSPEMNAHVIERVELENRLRQAVEAGEFMLEYQPGIEVATGRVTGVEALVRWRHPERGLLLPDAFLPVAEESGLIVPIGEWVLREACRQARAWRDDGHAISVAVNLSAAQLADEGLLPMIDRALHDSGLAPQALDLEILENTVIDNGLDIGPTAMALRARGVQLSMDRFGTGLSSLASLRRVPLSKLKLDRSYVGDVEHDPVDAAMVPAIIAVARSLQLRVVAEGVETADQLAFLRRHGCDEYQGFYASPASARPDFSPHPS
ncbi:putative bifunctional diguanylate cyclase/phosphodiesterase [Massilia sp. DD77]|uniref:putative bifunctional diguanylate cyclase/phosphodiesterase n=1 Tax=Massilia sp. DD77 TaxID=3109349 RepID=UPI002FFF0DF4